MTERPSDSGLSSGDPLGGGSEPEAPRHPSGLPGAPPAPERPTTSPGYASPPPPGAGGPVAQPAYGGVMGQHVLAGWGARAGALIIDGLIVGAGALVLFLPIGAAAGAGFASDSDASIGAAILGLLLWVVCVTLVALLYAPVMMSRTNGKTLGRMVMNIRVVRTSGEPISFGFAMLREVAVKALGFGIAGSVTFGLANLLDYLWPLWDEENRCLHDFIVSTRVVKD
jgi:uncharacterized RDD family membrane protein YckC